MIELEDAAAQVIQRVKQVKPTKVSLANALYRVLSEDIISDVDAPPHDKAMMDGFAVRAADVTSDNSRLEIVGTVTAGERSPPPLAAGQALRIMTGAPVPPGCDAVVMREATDDPPDDASHVTIHTSVPPEKNILRRATNMAVGDTVLAKGTKLRPIELGILADVGCASVPIVGTPTAGILATGNELVPVDQMPMEGQIRNTNGPMLCAMARTNFCHANNLGIARDSSEDLKRRIQKGLEFDFLIMSGGVSVGDLDLVPSVLNQLGVTEVFHKVRIKPGKPVWFGTSQGGTLVFGLPGNPVSSLVCFQLLVRPAMLLAVGERLSDDNFAKGGFEQGQLLGDRPQLGDRRTFWPARIAAHQGGVPQIELLPWKGSSDLLTMSQADCLVDFASDQPASSEVSYVKLT